MAGPFVSAGAHAPHADETHDLRLRGGRRTPLVAYAPSLSWAPPWRHCAVAWAALLMLIDQSHLRHVWFSFLPPMNTN